MMSLPNKSNAPNNPNTISDEMLSAFFDGELPHDQEARVEQWLSRSPEGRQKLDDLRRLSDVVQELPRVELPPEFAAQVLQQAERQMLLPAAMAQPLSTWRKVRWWTLGIVAPLAATAALLFLSLRLQNPNAQPDPIAQPAREVAGTRADRSILPTNERQEEESNTLKAAGATSGEALVTDVAKPAAASGDDASVTAESASQLSKAPAGIVSDELKVTAASDAETATRLAALVEKIQASNEEGQIPVVRVYVVDRRQGMELVQVVLDEHHIPRDPQRDSKTSAFSKKADGASNANSPAAPTSTAPSSEPSSAFSGEALFVVGDVAELQGALTSLVARNDGKLDWKLDNPIELQRFDSQSKAHIEEALVALRNTGPAEPAAPAATPPLAAGKSGFALAAVKSDARRPAARQLLVKLSEPLPAASAEPPVKAGESVIAAKESRRTASAEGKPSRRSRVHLIVVVEPQPPAAPPAKAAPAEPKPGDGAA